MNVLSRHLVSSSTILLMTKRSEGKTNSCEKPHPSNLAANIKLHYHRKHERTEEIGQEQRKQTHGLTSSRRKNGQKPRSQTVTVQKCYDRIKQFQIYDKYLKEVPHLQGSILR